MCIRDRRIVKVFWGLSASLAYARHFPAIDWLQSYSLYTDRMDPWFVSHVDSDWPSLRQGAMRILQEEAELQEIVRLVGQDALSFKDRLTLEAARILREDYLHQNAFHEVDTYASLAKQHRMLQLMMTYYDLGQKALAQGATLSQVLALPIRERIGRAKYIPEEQVKMCIRDRISTIAGRPSSTSWSASARPPWTCLLYTSRCV